MNKWDTGKLMAALGDLDGFEAEAVQGRVDEDTYVTVPFADREAVAINQGGEREFPYFVVREEFGTPTRDDDGGGSTDFELAEVDEEWLVAVIVRAVIDRRLKEIDAQNAAFDAANEHIGA